MAQALEEIDGRSDSSDGPVSEDDNSRRSSPRAEALSPNEEKLYKRLKKLNLVSWKALWAFDGPVHRALTQKNLAQKYLEESNPKIWLIWLMYSRCQTSEEFRSFLYKLSTLIADKNEQAVEKFIQLGGGKQLPILKEFVRELIQELITDFQASRETNFLQYIQNLPDENITDIFHRWRNKVIQSDPMLSQAMNASKVTVTLIHLLNGQLSDYELFNHAYGYGNYLTQTNAQKAEDEAQAKIAQAEDEIAEEVAIITEAKAEIAEAEAELTAAESEAKKVEAKAKKAAAQTKKAEAEDSKAVVQGKKAEADHELEEAMLDSNNTPYAPYNTIITTINERLDNKFQDDQKSDGNLWKTTYSMTNQLAALQTNLDRKVEIRPDLKGYEVQSTPIEVQRMFMSAYQGPLVTLRSQNRNEIADHFERTHAAANIEFFKHLYFSGTNQARLAQYLEMPDKPQRYDEFLLAATQLKPADPCKQALVAILTRVHNNEISQRGFHIELKKILFQHNVENVPKISVFDKFMRVLAYGLSYLKPRKGAALRAKYDTIEPEYFHTVFERNGEALREQYRQNLRTLNRNFKAAYFDNYDKVTTEYIDTIDTKQYDQLRSIATHESSTLHQLDLKSNRIDYETISRDWKLNGQDNLYRNALSRLHFLSKDRAKNRTFNTATLQRNIDAMITEDRESYTDGSRQQPTQAQRSQYEATKSRLQSFMCAAEKQRFKADINNALVDEVLQPIMQHN